MKARYIEISSLKGLGKKYVEILNEYGIYTVKDLFLTYPYRYESFIPSDLYNITNYNKVTLVGTVISNVSYQYYRNNLNSLTFKMIVSGEVINVIIFNRKYLQKLITPNSKVMVCGKYNYFKKELVAIQVFPHKTEGFYESFYKIKEIPSSIIQRAVKTALDSGIRMEEYLPHYVIEKNNFLDINDLIECIHSPKNPKDITLGRGRRKYEEILNFFIRVNYFKSLKEKNTRDPIKYDIVEVKRFIETIPFELSVDQKNVCNEIFRDFKKIHPANRLIQGDVGSGKTIVALISAFAMVTAKKQVVIMAPTEILASQHYEYFRKMLSGFNVNIGLFTAATSKSNRNIILSNLRSGECDIVIGTHALFYEDITYKNLGLVIIDEQHRFGVKARNNLFNDQSAVDALFLSATPIPRTLGLTIFGDLDISTIKTARANKKSVETKVFLVDDIDVVLDNVEEEIKKGHQVYFVVSAIESEFDDSRFDILDVNNLLSQRFPNYKIGTLHGKVKEKEKNAVMERFLAKEIDMLVSTTVIEVGISVDNATTMVILDAQNFGLSQLHQLRGRVGRGDLEGYCYLVTNDIEKERLNVLATTNDGFALAEMDLKLRGPGDYFSIRQSGIPDFVFADFSKDIELFMKINKDAMDLFLLQEHDKEIKKYISDIVSEIEIKNQLN